MGVTPPLHESCRSTRRPHVSSVVNHRGIVLGRDYRGTPFVSVVIARLGVTDLNLRCYEEFEAETKDMTGDSTVAEIKASGSTAWGSRSMSVTSVFRSLGRATRSRRAPDRQQPLRRGRFLECPHTPIYGEHPRRLSYSRESDISLDGFKSSLVRLPLRISNSNG